MREIFKYVPISRRLLQIIWPFLTVVVLLVVFSAISMGSIIALGHHEKYDGTGYPNGLHGEDIPLVARVVAVADVFDALVSERPYKHAWPIEESIDFVKSQRGKHFDPTCVDAFLADPAKVDLIRRELAD